jgi:hypothetical protein
MACQLGQKFLVWQEKTRRRSPRQDGQRIRAKPRSGRPHSLCRFRWIDEWARGKEDATRPNSVDQGIRINQTLLDRVSDQPVG